MRSERFDPTRRVRATGKKARLFEGLLDFQDAPRIYFHLRAEASEKVLGVDRTHLRAIDLVPAISVNFGGSDIFVVEAAGGSASLRVGRDCYRTNTATDRKTVTDQAKDKGGNMAEI